MKTWAGYVTAGKEGRVQSGELRVNGARRTVYQLGELRGPLKPVRDHWIEEVLIQYVTLFYSEKSTLLLFGITHSFLLVLVLWWIWIIIMVTIIITIFIASLLWFITIMFYPCILFSFFFYSNSLVKKVGAYHVNILLLLFFLSQI